ncbi:deleted in malignant brain tumors 1 protein-like [Strongylocentrotus purpuratus]|uniref:SRCR domain-containing protein n=1 Tax=Strongylocentrotus purpuratus TaxID=7668 RepID=A0A7M7NT25_STRPU|nr:deleted in malignant brain tumors 1 protein-like [Strongylocentrotus purpuratus]
MSTTESTTSHPTTTTQSTTTQDATTMSTTESATSHPTTTTQSTTTQDATTMSTTESTTSNPTTTTQSTTTQDTTTMSTTESTTSHPTTTTQSTTTQDATTMSTTESATSHPTTTTQSTTTQDATTMSTTESTTSHPTTTIQSTTTQDATTMSTTESATSHPTTTTQSTTTQDATTMSTTESSTSHPTTTTESTTTQDTTTMSTTESTTSHPTTTTQSTTTQDSTTMSTTESTTSHPTTTTQSTTTQDTTTMFTMESTTSHPTTTTPHMASTLEADQIPFTRHKIAGLKPRGGLRPAILVDSRGGFNPASIPSRLQPGLNPRCGSLCKHDEFEGGIRLISWYSSDEGRVEIFHDGQWGTVCGDGWDDSDARVVCRQLGYSGDVGVAWRDAPTYGQGFGSMYLSNVDCSGNETRLTDCSNGGWGNHDCSHTKDAGVYCGDEVEGGIRLISWYSSDEGSVEIVHDGQWGTVCGDGWDDSDARVVCRQLGYSGDVGVAWRDAPTYGQGFGSMYLSNVDCSGNETRLTDCSNGGWGNHDCSHTKDAGVYCGDEVEGGIRLISWYSSDEGRVEIFHDGQWGTVCGDGWDDSDARVVCRQLGYSGDVGVAWRDAPTYGQGFGSMYLSNVDCSGNETRLTDCSNGGWGNHDCSHTKDAGVYCGDEVEGGIRLISWYSSDEGRVEIFHDGQWGTVCGDGWDDSDARVVCRQLGYSGDVGVAWRDAPTYGQGFGSMYLSNVDCSGNETRLTDCSNGGWGNHDCSHTKDAGVYCGDEVEGGIRLISWYSSDEGSVEIFHDGQWGTVCGDGWDDSDARVVCRQLGYSGDVGVAWRDAPTYGQGFGSMYLSNVDCSGNETRLTDCSNGGWGNHDCSHTKDAGVYCGDEVEGGIRLISWYSSDEGRVEIFHDGQWGTVCGDGWDDSDARVVCRQLGYSGDVGVAWRDAPTYGQGFGSMYLSNVDCSGNETRLTDCSNGGWGNHDCSHTKDAGVYCGDEIEGGIRLISWYSSDEGRVEIFHEGQWGTVCDDGWDDSEARVVCRQLGYSGNVGVARSGGTYGQGSGPVYLSNVGCSGNESRLTDCSNAGLGDHDCSYTKGAGVYCGDAIEGEIRLIRWHSSGEGRVEIFHERQWGAVCDDGWDDSDARVVCRQLGYSDNVGVGWSGGTYGQLSGPIYLRHVDCSGHESMLTDCRNGGWGNQSCGHSEYAGVYC